MGQGRYPGIVTGVPKKSALKKKLQGAALLVVLIIALVLSYSIVRSPLEKPAEFLLQFGFMAA